MRYLIFALFTFATVPQWDFQGEPAAPHYIHVVHNGVDLGRAQCGTTYYGELDTVVVVSDEIFCGGFQ